MNSPELSSSDRPDLEKFEGVWFIYDGECPICSMAAQALRIRQQLGPITLFNARADQGHPLLERIREQGMDLDEGMALLHQGQFYHGQAALRFMARYGEPRGWFNRLFLPIFRSDIISRLTYPWMRGVRNLLLRIRKKPAIDNLELATQPIFKPVFGTDWEHLSPVLKKHYAIRPYSSDTTIVDGVMNVECYWPLKMAQPFYRLMGSVPLATEYGVRCTVHFKSDPNSRSFGFIRHFWFVQRRYYRFHSRMIALGGDRVIEVMRFGFCWCIRYRWQENKVMLSHDGYAVRWFGHVIPLPVTWLLGRGDAEETALDEDRFAMQVLITHPLFGKLYSYTGTFRVTQVQKTAAFL